MSDPRTGSTPQVPMFAVDVGGTFTDIVGIRDGEILATKVPTRYDDTAAGVLEGARAIDAAAMEVFNHASTIGLNAVLTRRLPKVGFITTGGHRDILDMGRVWRPLEALTDANWRRTFADSARPLVPRYLRRGVRERITADGEVLVGLDEEQARAELERFGRCGVEGVAICLLNAYVADRHEVRLRELVREVLGEVPCSISSEVSPLAKEYARASTTVVDVLMRIIYSRYSASLVDGLRELGFEGDVNFADCAAMLVPSDLAMEHPFRIVSSGPAAGAMSSAYFGHRLGDQNLICCDVGGTSCDISLVTDGAPYVNTTFELEHDLVVNALSTEISALSAGGGSIVKVDPMGQIQVGPDSAGSTPGPACYGRGGTAPTITDACLLIGILSPDSLLGGKLSLDPELSRRAFAGLETPLALEDRIRYAYQLSLTHIAEGIVDVAVKRGIDPRDYSLVAYGAAGPMLLAGVLEMVRARRVIVPPYPGLFSAFGLLSSDLVYAESRSRYEVLTPEAAPSLNELFAEMESRLLAQVGDASGARVERSFDGRLVGQTWETPFVPVPNGEITAATVATMVDDFHANYERRSGESFRAMPVQGVTYRVQVVVPMSKVDYEPGAEGADGEPEPVGELTLRNIAEGDLHGFVYDRSKLGRGQVVRGPAVIREELATTYLNPGQRAEVGVLGEIVITIEGADDE